MVFESIAWGEHCGDATLCIGAVRFLEAVLGNDENGERGIDGQCRPETCQPATDNQHVCEEMGNSFGMEWDQVSWCENRHKDISKGRDG